MSVSVLVADPGGESALDGFYFQRLKALVIDLVSLPKSDSPKGQHDCYSYLISHFAASFPGLLQSRHAFASKRPVSWMFMVLFRV